MGGGTFLISDAKMKFCSIQILTRSSFLIDQRATLLKVIQTFFFLPGRKVI